MEITVLNTDPPEGNIDRILERKSELIRPAVANIDQALVVFAIQDPGAKLKSIRQVSGDDGNIRDSCDHRF